MTGKLIPLFRLCLILTVYSIEILSEELCDLSVRIEHNLYNDGFHRNLSYHIKFLNQNDDWKWNDGGLCSIAMEQILPAGVYASPDEVRKYQNDFFRAILFKNPVDIELPANDAPPVIMHFTLDAINSEILFSLPVHARYHPAVAGGGMARNEILPPKIYLNCRDKRLQECEKTNNRMFNVRRFCLQDTRPESCEWKEIPATIVTEAQVWDVPVGNSDDFYVVAFGTALVVALGSLYLLKAIHEFKIDSTTKINDKKK